MGKCIVKECNSRTQVDKASDGISFHTIPKDPVRREKWVEVIRVLRKDPKWNATNTTVICSKHFRNEDRVLSKLDNGRIYLLDDAVPLLDDSLWSNTESSAADGNEGDVNGSADGQPAMKTVVRNLPICPKSRLPFRALATRTKAARSSRANTDVMATMVDDNITDPTRPVKRRVDVLLLMCQIMMREKDHEITILRKQVEKLTKHNLKWKSTLLEVQRRTGINLEDLIQMKDEDMEPQRKKPKCRFVRNILGSTERLKEKCEQQGENTAAVQVLDNHIQVKIEVDIEGTNEATDQLTDESNTDTVPEETNAPSIEQVVIKKEVDIQFEYDPEDAS
ncbi:uncharacterized protein LOC113510032 [Galleria mellonella]|uniref:Uncharacterized protein LOC113510032 n=1 Tax=Galleria mellonella TaxID=7137 RepID=A0ABM3MUT8_GALME|nr:uncharacterized protein LOC113510032 [Galleria mellonella]